MRRRAERIRASDRVDVVAALGHATTVLRKRTRYLLKLPGVVGAAVGFRRRKGRLVEEPVITVFVEYGLKRRSIENVPRKHRIPRSLRARIGSRSHYIPIDLVPSRLGRLCRTTSVDVAAGNEVSNERSLENKGTLGWVARFSSPDDSRPVVCGACHVLLRLLESNFRGGSDKTFVFSDTDLEQLAIPPNDGADFVSGIVVAGRRGGGIDAAVATLLDGEPTGWIPALRRQLQPCRRVNHKNVASNTVVKLVARNDTVREGTLTRFPATMTFGYEDAPDGVVIKNLIETDIAVFPGDSGGLLVDDSVHPVGMLLGAASRRSYFVHLYDMAQYFHLTNL